MSDLELLSVEEALNQTIAHFERLPPQIIKTGDGLDRMLAEDVKSKHNVPPFANSAMDGYAVKAADVAQATPENAVKLQVIEDIPAGVEPKKTIESGLAARIMTGAPLPPGADAIVPVEKTDEDWQASGRDELPAPDYIQIYASVKPGQYVRLSGEDIAANQIALKSGTLLRPQEIGVLAAIGVPEIKVTTQPRVAVLSTGDELLPIDAEITPGKIRDVNGYTITNLVRLYGGRPLWLGIAGDQPQAVRKRLQAALDQGANAIVSSAGVSVGAYDVVRDVLAEFGQVDFWRVRMRPGKPLAFGLVGDVPFFGLPGNPVSAMVSFDIFVRPAILKMGGHPWQLQTTPVMLAEDLRSDGRESYLRVRVAYKDGQLTASSVGAQGSGILTSMVHANALLIIPEGVTEVRAGDTLQARLFDERHVYPH